jgi:hypothetical protein
VDRTKNDRGCVNTGASRKSVDKNFEANTDRDYSEYSAYFNFDD